MWQALIKLIEKCACCHNWETHFQTSVYEKSYNKRPWEIQETLICQKCGKIKKIKL